jgi:hypothetical protein
MLLPYSGATQQKSNSSKQRFIEIQFLLQLILILICINELTHMFGYLFSLLLKFYIISLCIVFSIDKIVLFIKSLNKMQQND